MKPRKLALGDRNIIGKHVTEARLAQGMKQVDLLAKLQLAGIDLSVPALSLLIPYHPAERPIETPPGFDNTYYPPGMEKVPRKLAIVRANRYMVDHVDYLIAYAWHPASNARDMVEYARKLETKGEIAITVLERINVTGCS